MAFAHKALKRMPATINLTDNTKMLWHFATTNFGVLCPLKKKEIILSPNMSAVVGATSSL